MTTKRKAPAPKATGAPPEKPTLESLAEQLRALDVDPGWVLYAALEGEKVARGKTPIDALRADPRAIYSPTVLESLAQAAIRCRTTGFSGRSEPIEGLEGLFLTELTIDLAKEPKAFLFEVHKALVLTELPAVKGAKRLLSATKALRLARAVDKEADRIAEDRYLEVHEDQCVTAALQSVAKENGTTATALRKAIQRARAAFPSDDWPKKKARHP